MRRFTRNHPESAGVNTKEKTAWSRLGRALLLIFVAASATLAQDNIASFEQLWSFGFGGVASVDYSPDESWIAVGGAGTVFLLNARSYEIEKQFFGHNGGIFSVKWSPDGKYLAAGVRPSPDGTRTGTVWIWEVETSCLLRTLEPLTRGVMSVTWSPDGRYVAAAADRDPTQVWEVASGVLVQSLSLDELSVAWSPDGKYLATGPIFAPVIRLWDTATWTLARELRGLRAGVSALAWSPDGRRLASGGYTGDGTVKVWDVETWKVIWSQTPWGGGEVNALAWEPEGQYVAAGTGGAIKVYAGETGDLVSTLSTFGEGLYCDVKSLAWAPEGEPLVSSGWVSVCAWEVASSELIVMLGGHRGEIESVTWSPDSRIIASSAVNLGDTIRLWAVETRQAAGTIADDCVGGVLAVEWSPSGSYLAVHGCGRLKVRDLQAEKELWRVPLPVFTRLAWSPDSRYLAARDNDRGGLQTTTIREAETGKPVRTLEGAGFHITWCPNGQYLAAMGLRRRPNNENWVRIWDTVTGALVEEIAEAPEIFIFSLTCSPDGRLLAYSTWSPQGVTIKIWQIEPRNLIREIFGYHVRSLSWRSDGRYLAGSVAQGWNDQIGIWDINTGNLITTLAGHFGQVLDIKWSPDGRYIASGGTDDRTVRLWGSPPAN